MGKLADTIKENKANKKPADYTENDLYSELDDIDQKIIELSTRFPAMKMTEMGKRLKLGANTISKRKNKVLLKEALIRITKNALVLIENNQYKAAETQVRLLQHPDGKIALGASREILKGLVSDNINLTVTETSKIIETSLKDAKAKIATREKTE